jgi:hypothetical protein
MLISLMNVYSYLINNRLWLLIADGQKSTVNVDLWNYFIISFIIRLYLLNYGVDVHPVNPILKISLLHHRAFSSRVKHFWVFPEIPRRTGFYKTEKITKR